MRRLALGFAVLFAVMLSGVAVASVVASSRQSPNPHASDRPERQQEAKDTGVHGGPIARFHGSGCGLTNVSSLQGNWTHGDYVSAVAQGGDSALIVQAAHSDCGKPMVSVTHGLGKQASKHAGPIGRPTEPGS
jgi:hypothetical protein